MRARDILATRNEPLIGPGPGHVDDDAFAELGDLRAASRKVTNTEVAIGFTLTVVVLLLWSIPALRSGPLYDDGLRYAEGVLAWRTGHPENLISYDGTPFLGFVDAVMSKVVTAGQSSWLLTVGNLFLLTALICATWWALRERLARWFWWTTLVGAWVFGPAISTVWWRQLNIIVLGLAVLAYVMFRHRRANRVWPGAIVLAFSIALKPMAVLLLLALLVRRDSRRAGVIAILWSIPFQAAGLAFLGERAHSLAVASPIHAYDIFTSKATAGGSWVCHDPENFSPQSMLCLQGGDSYWSAQRVVIVVGVLLLSALVFHTIRGQSGFSWRMFAYGCALSPMISPIAWSHYQIMLAPLFIVLVSDFHRYGAAPVFWIGALSAFVLAELVWRPYGTLPGALNHLLRGPVENMTTEYTVYAYAAWAQYVLLGTAMLYYHGLTVRLETLRSTARRGHSEPSALAH